MARSVAALSCALALQACIAVAAIPVAAGASIGRKAVRKAPEKRQPQAGGRLILLPPGTKMPAPTDAPAPRPDAPAQSGVTAGMQYLYGSGEAAALSIQAWRALIRHVAGKVLERPKESVVLAPGATLAKPVWETCGRKPMAVVLDIDETVVLNLGLQSRLATGAALTPDQRAQWDREGGDKVVAVPGAAGAVEALRTMGVEVVFIGDRPKSTAGAAAAMIAAVGLGEAVPDKTLFLAEEGETARDPRRAAIASLYCVLAIAGDQLGDFTDLFDAGQGPAVRRAETLFAPVNARLGAGWFLLPNPVHGTGLRGGVDDVFPQDMRWTPAP
jgi:predicted secreted acid phosphatase